MLDAASNSDVTSRSMSECWLRPQVAGSPRRSQPTGSLRNQTGHLLNGMASRLSRRTLSLQSLHWLGFEMYRPMK